jgi:glycosyltransferase involved in cell wall biosynthesis
MPSDWSEPRPMRIAVDANVLNAPWGGIPKYLSRIAAELARGDEVELFANSRRLPVTVPGTRAVTVRVKGTPIWRNAFLPLAVAGRRADLLWAPESVLPRWSPVPAVVTIHDLAALSMPGLKPAAHVERFRHEVARSVDRATLVIAVSRSTAAEITAIYGTDPAKLRVVPNGVDEAFTPGDRAAASAAVAGRWGIDSPFVLHVGSIEPRKGLDVLIAAGARARAAGLGWRVVLAGSVGYRGEPTVEAARESGVCDLLGPVDESELLDLMRAAGAFAAPALHEGFGIAPLEAMACGTPAVIAADSGGLEEVSAAASIVVAKRDPLAWVEALERALARPEDLIERGLAHAARFRWPQVAAETRAVFAEATDP